MFPVLYWNHAIFCAANGSLGNAFSMDCVAWIAILHARVTLCMLLCC